jgi:hypothetical protein
MTPVHVENDRLEVLGEALEGVDKVREGRPFAHGLAECCGFLSA